MIGLQKAYRVGFILFLLLCIQPAIHTDYFSKTPYTHIYSQVDEQEFIDCNVLKECTKNYTETVKKSKKHKTLVYYLYIADFIASFIQIPTSNVSVDSSTVSSTYLAGRAPVFNKHNEKVGVCSASFLCMQNADNIYTDIANYLSVANGLIITWFTPTTLINLEVDSIVHSMVTECIVTSSTKVGFNPFYGKKFDMVVSSNDQKIYFKLKER